MAVPYVAQTWVDGPGGGTPKSAARLAVMEQGISDAHRMPTARVYNTATFAVAHNTLTAVTFDSERWDTDTIHDTATNTSRLTAKKQGTYLVGGTVLFPAVSAGYRDVQIALNGTTTLLGRMTIPANTGTDATVITLSGLQWTMAVNDYVELKVAQTTGSSMSVAGPGGTGGPEFWMTRVAS